MDKMNCDRLIDYFNQNLSDEDKARFETHLKECPQCQAELKEWGELTGDLVYLSEPVAPPAGMKGRILDRVFEEEPAVKPDAGKQAEVKPFPAKRRNWWAPLLAAALFLSLLGNGYAWTVLNKEEAADPVAGIDDVKLKSETDSTGDASLFEKDGKLNVLVEAGQLKPLEGDQVYQVWLLKDGKPVPAGAFEPDASGKGAVYHTIDDDGTKWDTIAITLEPKAGNTLPEGEIVLSSALTL